MAIPHLVQASVASSLDEATIRSTAAALVIFQLFDGLQGTSFGSEWAKRWKWFENLPFFALVFVVAVYWAAYLLS